MSNYTTGHQAEKKAAEFLQKQGFTVLQLNWKTPYCEIDIVAEKAKVIYLVEVKCRQDTRYGGGLDYITPKKLKQMKFAAELWVAEHNWDSDYQLAAVEIEKDRITSFLSEL